MGPSSSNGRSRREGAGHLCRQVLHRSSGYQHRRLEDIRIYHESEGMLEKSVTRITDWHNEACRVMSKGDRERRIFLSEHTQIMNYFSFSSLSLAFYI